jgi:cysteine desulfurase/selenocysteine lyase
VTDWWEELRAEFPLCNTTAYFFAGGQTPLAVSVRTAMTDVIAGWDELPWRIATRRWDDLDRCQAAIAELLACTPTQVIACEGTSGALNLATLIVLQRLRASGRRRANVVLHREAHPAGSYPWHNAVRLGEQIELRWPEPVPGESDVDALASAVDEHTIAVVVSHVSHQTGRRLDVLELAKRFPDRRWALVVDAAQSAGAVPLAAAAAAADFVAFPAYKWLFGPPGVGFLVVGEAWLRDPGPPLVGWAAAGPGVPVDARRFDLAGGGNGFRLGIPNEIGLAGAAAGLELSARFGPDRIAERIQHLTGRFVAGIDDLGVLSPTPRAWSDRAGIVSLDLDEPDVVVQELHERSLEAGVVNRRLRVDLHAFNEEAEVDRLLEALRALCSSSVHR